MRWESVFEDMEAQFAAQRQRQVEGEAAEEAIHLRAAQLMAERLLGHLGQDLRLGLLNGRVAEGVVADVGAGWLVLGIEMQQVLVPMASVEWWEPTVRRAVSMPEARLRTLSLNQALRALARTREEVRVYYGTRGRELDTLGRLRRIGADYVEVDETAGADGGLGRSGRLRIFPVGSVVAISSASWGRRD